jgi:hypothetical protein
MSVQQLHVLVAVELAKRSRSSHRIGQKSLSACSVRSARSPKHAEVEPQNTTEVVLIACHWLCTKHERPANCRTKREALAGPLVHSMTPR